MSPEPASVPPPLQTQPEPSPPQGMNEGARLIGVFFSPGKAFADIARRPTWWIPLIIAAVFSTIYLNAFTQRVGWESVIRPAIERSANTQNMPAQQREQLIRTTAGIYKYVGYGSAVLTLFYVFIVAVLLMFLFDTMMSAGIGLKRMMAIVAYGFLPLVIQTALSMLVLFLKDPEEFNLQNPLMFNVGAYLSPDAPAALRALGSSIDVFSLWIIILLAIGVSSAARKMSFGKAFAGIALPWALFVGLKTMAAAAGMYNP
ncbi:MAG TPA: Yip1 family protein [Bryobacteraceae bacterium]|nr:Yip1 family protein [Bryobacteraceae bacterium]